MNIKNKKSLSLAIKVLLYFSIFSIFILLLLWCSQMLFLRVYYEKFQIKDMNRISTLILNSNSKNIESLLKNITYYNSVCVEQVEKDGKIHKYNETLTGCMFGKENEEFEKKKKELLKNKEKISSINIENKEFKAKALLYLVKKNDDNYIYIYTMLSNIDNNTVIIRGQMIYITLLVIIFAIIISLFLSKRISKPIIEITKKSNEVASGNYNVEFKRSGIIEIDELANTLNYLESEASKVDEYRRDLMANVSHDLKTPLTMIKAYAEMIKDISFKNKKKMDEHINVIISETNRLNLLVGDILTLSKLQANADTLNIEKYDLSKEIKELVKRYEIIKETEDYKIEVDMPNEVIVKADKNKINQVLYNLVNNALNYTGEDKKISIVVTDEKKNYLVEIKDSGKGIDKDKIKLIWERYYKHEKNHKRNMIGTGLGLSIVKNILVIHNFDYGVKSIKKKGTTFYFKIKKVDKTKQ